MAKTVKSMEAEAESRWLMWLEIAEDHQALTDRGKTREEAVILANYFEGRMDGLRAALSLTAE